MMKIMIVFFTHCVIFLYMVWQVEASAPQNSCLDSREPSIMCDGFYLCSLCNPGRRCTTIENKSGCCVITRATTYGKCEISDLPNPERDLAVSPQTYLPKPQLDLAVSPNKCVLGVKNLKQIADIGANPVFFAESDAPPYQRYIIKLAMQSHQKELKKEFDLTEIYENAQELEIKIVEKFHKNKYWEDLQACGDWGKQKEVLETTVVGADIIVMLDMGDTLAKVENIRSITDIERITRNMIRSIEGLHKQNIIHRDIRPDNVCKDGNVLINFGIALNLNYSEDLEKLQTNPRGSPFFHIITPFHRFQNYFMLDYHGILMTASWLNWEALKGDSRLYKMAEQDMTQTWRVYFQNHDNAMSACANIFKNNDFLQKYCIWVLNPYTIQDWQTEVIKELDELQKIPAQTRSNNEI